MTQPTNHEIKVELDAYKVETALVHKAMNEKMDTLATKEDIAELKEFMKAITTTIGVFRFTWNNAAKIGSILLLLGGLVVFVKGGLLAGVSYILGKN